MSLIQGSRRERLPVGASVWLGTKCRSADSPTHPTVASSVVRRGSHRSAFAAAACRRRRSQTVRRLAALAGILGPMTLIATFWGVNLINIPGTDASRGWPVFVVAEHGFALLAVAYLRQRALL